MAPALQERPDPVLRGSRRRPVGEEDTPNTATARRLARNVDFAVFSYTRKVAFQGVALLLSFGWSICGNERPRTPVTPYPAAASSTAKATASRGRRRSGSDCSALLTSCSRYERSGPRMGLLGNSMGLSATSLAAFPGSSRRRGAPIDRALQVRPGPGPTARNVASQDLGDLAMVARCERTAPAGSSPE